MTAIDPAERTRAATIRLKCPYCIRRFDDIEASREHVDAVHREGRGA